MRACSILKLERRNLSRRRVSVGNSYKKYNISFHENDEMNHKYNLVRSRFAACAAFTFMSMCVASANAEVPSVQQPSDDTKIVEPFVGETTFLILKLDPNRFELPPDAASLGDTPETKAAISTAMKTANAALSQLRALADGKPVFATVGLPFSEKRVPVYLFRLTSSKENTAGAVKRVNDSPVLNAQVRGQYIVALPKTVAKEFPTEAPPATTNAIRKAVESVASYPAYAIIVPPEYVWRTVKEVSPELPSQLGGGSSRVLTEGIRSIAIGLDAQKLHIEAVIQSASDQAAQEFAKHLPVMLSSAYEAATFLHARVPQDTAELVIDWLKPEVDGSQVKIRIEGIDKTGTAIKLIAGIAQKINERTTRESNQNRFRQILLAMHNYYDVYRAFPPADKQRGKDGKPRLSWRVYLLPYLEQRALYDQFHLDEPWDSPHNKTLIEKMPEVYASSSQARSSLKPGYTTLQVPIGAKTIFGGDKATKFSQITDGTSYTIALIEVTPKKAVPWTSPEDFAFDPKNPLAGIQVGKDGIWQCAFADGSVHYLHGELSPKTVLHLFQMNDGNVVKLD